MKGEILNVNLDRKQSNTPVKTGSSEGTTDASTNESDKRKPTSRNEQRSSNKESQSRSRTPPVKQPRKRWNIEPSSQGKQFLVPQNENKLILHSESDNNLVKIL